MVLVEDPLRLDDVEVLLAPRDQGSSATARGRCGGPATPSTRGRGASELFHSRSISLRASSVQVERVELLLQLLQVVAVVLALAELLLDRLHLLAQEHLALPVAQLLLDLRLDLLLRVEDVDLALDVDERPAEAVLDGERLEQELPLGRRDVDVAGDEVGEPARVVRLGEDVRDRLVGQAELLGRARPSAPSSSFRSATNAVSRASRGGISARLDDGRLEAPVLLLDPHRDAARLPLEEQARSADAPLDRADRGDRPDRVEELGRDALEVLPLRDGEDELSGLFIAVSMAWSVPGRPAAIGKLTPGKRTALRSGMTGSVCVGCIMTFRVDLTRKTQE